MQWLGRRQSSNVDDRRGITGGHVAAGGGIGAVIIYLIYSFISGNNIDPNAIPQLTQPTEQSAPMTATDKAEDDKRAEFVKVVLAETEDVWNKIFREKGEKYIEPKLVMFRGEVASACGSANSASGPFYCPGDQQLYIDLSFYEDLQNKLNVPGDFPMAYVIAHEVGHHIQNLMGTTDKMAQLRQQLNETEYNKYSVRLELQADFYAGVWAHYEQQMKNSLDPGDIDEALNAANAIGDDRLQKQATGRVVPDAFTHGTSAQRVYWFKKGYETGDLSQGDTFKAGSL